VPCRLALPLLIDTRYNVVGWSVHEMKTATISEDEYRAGDIVYGA
jgi:hypothetical protein